MRLPRTALALLLPLCAAACASTAPDAEGPASFPAVEYAVVRAVHDDGSATNAMSDPRDVLVEVQLYTRRVLEASLAALPEMSGMSSTGERSWMAPTGHVDDAFARAGFHRVEMPEMRARPGLDAATFIGETVRLDRGDDGLTVHPVAVGYEAVVCPIRSHLGRVRLALDVRARRRDDAARTFDGAEPNTFELPAGYAAIVRLDPDTSRAHR